MKTITVESVLKTVTDQIKHPNPCFNCSGYNLEKNLRGEMICLDCEDFAYQKYQKPENSREQDEAYENHRLDIDGRRP